MNKVVARYVDGRMLKGFTSDFNPSKDEFHVTPDGATGPRIPSCWTAWPTILRDAATAFARP
jgi:hypothetical protein